MTASVKIHRSEHSTAISTNASTEAEFLLEVARQLEGTAVADDLARLLPQVVNICCKLRGYKADVIEHRVIVSGEWMPDDVVEAFSTRVKVQERTVVTA